MDIAMARADAGSCDRVPDKKRRTHHRDVRRVSGSVWSRVETATGITLVIGVVLIVGRWDLFRPKANPNPLKDKAFGIIFFVSLAIVLTLFLLPRAGAL